MRYLYIDCIGGASGDMLLGAFLDQHVPIDYLKNELSQLKLDGYELVLEDTFRHHISSKKLTVQTEPDPHSHRHLSHILKMIDESKLSAFVKEQAAGAFQRLGREEANVHNMPIEKVHFHEVGAVDSIVDIIGAFICVEYLQVDRIFASMLPVSRGRIKAAHGILPVPAPATMGLLKGYPLSSIDMEGELVTPTGALLVSQLSQGLLPRDQAFTVDTIGYGAGSKDFEAVPNLVRVWTGQLHDRFTHDSLLQIETNIDDLNPEIYPYVMEKLFAAGVNDVSIYQAMMKKGRPGVLVSILADPALFTTVKNILFSETSTIGLRYHTVHREHLPRRVIQVESQKWGKIKVKEVQLNGDRRLLPEFEECKRIAAEHNLGLHAVYQQLQQELTGKA